MRKIYISGKNESYKEANSKITEENVELKEKIKKLKESTAELIKENGQLTSEYLETKAKEAATLGRIYYFHYLIAKIQFI